MDSSWSILDVIYKVHIIGEMSIQQLELQRQKRRNNNTLKGREIDDNQFGGLPTRFLVLSPSYFI